MFHLHPCMSSHVLNMYVHYILSSDFFTFLSLKDKNLLKTYDCYVLISLALGNPVSSPIT